MATTTSTGTRSRLFQRDGHFRLGTALLLFVGFGLFMGFGSNVTWWLRTGDFAYVITTYAFLFSTYHALTALTMHRVVLRTAGNTEQAHASFPRGPHRRHAAVLRAALDR
jgi:hypothetical protein